MRADDIYRFALLRQPGNLRPRLAEEVTDPFIPAYTRDTIPPRQSLRGALGLHLAGGQTNTARILAESHLARYDQPTPWDLVFQLAPRLQKLCVELPGIVASGDVDAAERAVAAAMDLQEFSATIARKHEIIAVREAVADFLGASSLLNIPGQEDAAHLICCFETIERLMAIADDGHPPSPLRGAWRIPLTAGIVELPFTLKYDWPSGSPLAGEKGDPNTTLKAGRTFRPRSFVGDLIVMKQHLRAYELGEIAHVSNVLAGETYERIHRTLDRSETRLLELEETEKQVEIDLQSTTRDEIQSEIQKSISEQTDLSANFNVNVSYMGPYVSVASSTGASASYRRASEERSSTAISHSQEVVSRASEKVRTRTLKQRERIETRETEQKATHSINNDTNEHRVGVYRWLEKRFDLHLINYGRRLIYEFTVPEPGVFWARLMATQSKRRSGPPPERPKLGNQDLTLEDFALRTNNAQLAYPPAWKTLVALAGEWGVTLEAPPLPAQQAHFALTLKGSDTADSSTSGARFANGFTVSPYVKVAESQESLTVPAGYRSYSGEIAMKGWRYLRKNDDGNYMYVDGEANVLLTGQRYRFTTNNDGNNTPTFSEGGLEGTLIGSGGIILTSGQFMEGEVPIVLASNLNTLSCSIKLDCQRTESAEHAWSQKMFLLFESAYRDRLSAYESDEERAAIRTEDWAANLPSQRAREIERDELKRSIVLQLSDTQLSGLTSQLLTEPSNSQHEPLLSGVSVDHLPGYERFLSFFEKAFDWSNIAYIFSPYFYGRREQWANLALAEHADPQFRKFLSAGAARVQVPVCRGYEAHVEYFFNGLGMMPFERRLPWLVSMRPIAEDLAADAREGFTLGNGRINIASNSNRLSGTNTLFNAQVDSGREIRIGVHIHIIETVISATEAVLSTPWNGTAQSNAFYELGGIVVGPAIPLRLPTTLVAIDLPNLNLPTFPPRYAE